MRKLKRLIYLTMIQLLAVAMLLPQPALADSGVVLKVRPGLGGVFKVEQPLELLITVENPGEEFLGSLMVRAEGDESRGYRPDQAAYVMEVKVPARAREQFTMVIPGELASLRPGVELVSGGQVLARSRVEGAAVGGGQLILALSEDIMGSGLQAWLAKSPGPQSNLKYITPAELPADPVLQGAADVIMVDAAAGQALTENQGRALAEWTRLGGVLMLFGGAGAGEGETFSEITPVLVTGRKTVDSRLAGLRTGGPLTVATGKLAAGAQALVQDGGSPVLARRKLGRGTVLFCGAAPGDLGGEAQGVWSALFSITPGLENVIQVPGRISRDFLNAQDVLIDTSSYIPQLAGPPVPLLALFWVIYAAAAGPLLYFILRRSDRRDLAWLLVPLGALAVTTFFYFLAPANRLQTYFSHTLASVEIFAPDLAEVRAGAAVVAPRGGDFLVGAARSYYLAPSRLALPGPVSTRVAQEDGNFEVNFANVEYGSLRRVSAYGLHREFGSIDSRLLIADNVLKGELVNKTGLDLRDCSLLLGSRAFRLGALPAGGAVYIEEALDDWAALSSPAELLPGGQLAGLTDDPYFRERRLLSRYNRSDFNNGVGVEFLGWHDGPPGVIRVTGGRSGGEDHGLLLVKQKVDLELSGGKFILPAGFITPRQVEAERVVYPDQSVAVKELHGGSFSLLYDLGDAGLTGNFQVSSLTFKFAPGQVPLKAEIYSPLRGRWELLPQGEMKLTTAELPGYLADNKVLLKMTPAGDITGPYPAWPGLMVEGVVTG